MSLNLQTIKEAAQHQQTVRIHYTDSAGKASERTVEPYEIKGDALYAHCLSGNGIRAFKLNGISSAVHTHERFEPRFDIKIV